MKLSVRAQWLAAAALVVAGAAALLLQPFFAPRKVPTGQAPLLVLDGSNLRELQQAFDAAADRPRIIAFLSPT